MANYDGSCRKVIRVLPQLHPFAMMFHGGYLYWTDWSRLNYKIYVTSIRDGSTSSFKSLNYRPYGIDFFGELNEAIGKWSQWRETQSCPNNCIGRRVQTRYCQNPFVHNYKRACLKTACQKSFKCVGSAGLEDGPQVKSIVCDVCLCKVDGQWGPWLSGQCSQTCGTGRMTRSRYCNNPTPRNCRSDCTGTHTTIVDCYLRSCPDEKKKKKKKESQESQESQGLTIGQSVAGGFVLVVIVIIAVICYCGECFCQSQITCCTCFGLNTQ
ncbi:hemicentin-1-like isoform X1 [Hydractinia symbiolongicarpus]|uniref:hemicentin-1-like isoform X1 n=1 Tax=Hydractinia symbiolongicarpus TaxID=13093 RepID=UPI00254A60B7|nr:hemicentin-1-like isoform X1 [Hydractinia symbiolongicarpus]